MTTVLRRGVIGAALALGLGAGTRARAQQGRVTAVVEYIAGSDIYLAAGTEQGIAPNDTLLVYDSPDGDPVGTFRVVSATATRAVVEFVGNPFPVTRGKTLYLRLAPGRTPAPAAAVVAAAAPEEPERPAAPAPSVHGRLTLEANAFETTTSWQSNTDTSETRKFATPSLGLRLVAADLPGGFSINTNLRALYRYSDPELINPAGAVQVYQASVAKTFTGAPLYFEVGRFNNPYSNFSGYWDGLLMHVGGRSGLGAGVAAGFEPNRGDQGVSTDLPKFAGFVTYSTGGGPIRYATDVSVHQVRPRTDLPDHTYFGWSQYLRVRRFRFGNDMLVDRNPETNSWVITRFNATASIPLARGLEIHGRMSVLQPYQFWQTQNLIPFRRDQGNVGLFYWGSRGSFGLDFTANRFGTTGDTTRQMSYTYSASFSLLRTPILGLDFSVSGSYWAQQTTKTLYATAGIGRAFGRVQTRASYQLFRSESEALTSLNHSVDATLAFPLARSLFATLQGRMQRGDNLRMNGLFAGFWTSF